MANLMLYVFYYNKNILSFRLYIINELKNLNSRNIISINQILNIFQYNKNRKCTNL